MPTCDKPDGGCGAEVIFVVSAKSDSPMILDPTPVKGIVLVVADDGYPPHPSGPLTLATNARQVEVSVLHNYRARVVDVFKDHHGTCSAWLAKVERERATRSRAARSRIAGDPYRSVF